MQVGKLVDILRDIHQLEMEILVLEAQIKDSESKDEWCEIEKKMLRDKQSLLGHFRNQEIE